MGGRASTLRTQQQQLVSKVLSRVAHRGNRRGFDLMRTRNNIDASTFYDIGDCIGLGSMGQARMQFYTVSTATSSVVSSQYSELLNFSAILYRQSIECWRPMEIG
jgi:hypothetical protein